jgi:hypothetical protein
MNANPSLRGALVLAGAALLLSACGGGGGGTPVPDPLVDGTDIPASATSSSAAAVAFVRSVAAQRDETALPITVGNAVLATSDTDEPEPGI